MSELNKFVAKQIVLAQIASDGGKGITDIARVVPIGHIYAKKGYRVKEICIQKALDAICGAKSPTGFSFFVTRGSFIDSRGIRTCSYLVYFNFKLNGESHQISFHSFSEEFYCYYKKGKPTRWKKRMDSKETAALLAEYLL